MPTRDRQISRILIAARKAGWQFVDEANSKRLLADYGFTVPAGEVVSTPTEAAEAAARLRKPLVVKLLSPDVLHKSDVGGVVLGLTSRAAVHRAASRLGRIGKEHGWRVDGFLVEEMISGGHEMIVGGVVDPRFGPMVTVGVGGVYVEYLDDVTLRGCPITEADAHSMIRDLRCYPLVFGGARGSRCGSEDALVTALLGIGGEHGLLTEQAAAIESIDINPVLLADDAIALDARIMLSDRSNQAPKRIRTRPNKQEFDALFAPRTVAVVGASTSRITLGNVFIRRIRNYGFDGKIFPIHPHVESIEGLASYRDFTELPEPVDYAYVVIPPDQIAPLIETAAGKASFVQVVTSGFAEIANGAERDERLRRAIASSGVRILGPNCLGTHSPRGRLTYLEKVSETVGGVGIISQSGGLSIDIARHGRRLGIEFSGIVTMGNSIDLDPADLLEFYCADDTTRTVGIYIEDVKDGHRFLDVLRENAGQKPIVLLVGGRTSSGRRAAASHTGALATDDRVWRAIAVQTAVVVTSTLDEFLAALAVFQVAVPHPNPTTEVVLFGNGGGASVLAADRFADRGLRIGPLPDPTLLALQKLALPPGSSVVNPIDTPADTLRRDDGRIAADILSALFAGDSPDALVIHLNLAAIMSFTDQRVDILGNLIQAVLDMQQEHPGETHVLLVLRSTGEPELETRRHSEAARAAARGIPVFETLEAAADALQALAHHERHASVAVER